ncbi:MAG: amylo-alpha-1,6-glucosidase [Syntrophothermus sp.]
MSYINFDKSQLVNLEYSLSRELLRSNRAGSYASSTIVNCNTRKYHGMLVAPQPGIDNENHVLLSCIDETIIQREAEFNLGIHKYPGGVFQPKGHKYFRDFTTEPIPKMTYNVGGVIFTKEMLFTMNEDRMIIKYTLEEAHSPTKLKLKPFLAFRSVHELCRENIWADKKYEKIPNGIRIRMYQGYTDLFMQLSKVNEYTHIPCWYYNIEYQEEMRRGYDYQEDLYVPGFFEMEIKKGESIFFCASTKEIQPGSMRRIFTTELNRRTPRNNFENCLVNAAEQFVMRNGNKTDILSSFPWFGRWGRDVFVAAPGLLLTRGDLSTYQNVIDSMVADQKGAMFPSIGSGPDAAYDSIDTSLWFFWALQQYVKAGASPLQVWKRYRKNMLDVLEGYKQGTVLGIRMNETGLLSGGEAGKAITWMDALSHGRPVTPRVGMAVEVNALWYNAIMFALELATVAKDIQFITRWIDISEQIPVSFTETFWNSDKGYLADYVNGDYKDWSVRPNMIFVASMPYSPVDEEIRKQVVSTVRRELLTPRGLRSLSPKNPAYKGGYCGDQDSRNLAYHQGTVWPWLLGHFVEGYLRLHEKSGLTFIKSLYEGFEDVMTEHGIGTVSEIYDGDPPHTARGAISQAWSVAELLRIHHLIKKYEDMD